MAAADVGLALVVHLHQQRVAAETQARRDRAQLRRQRLVLSGAQLFQRRSVNHATAIAYSPNSRVLAIGTEDGRVLFLNARSGAVQAPALQTTGKYRSRRTGRCWPLGRTTGAPLYGTYAPVSESAVPSPLGQT